jgi:hypothetical protein
MSIALFFLFQFPRLKESGGGCFSVARGLRQLTGGFQIWQRRLQRDQAFVGCQRIVLLARGHKAFGSLLEQFRRFLFIALFQILRKAECLLHPRRSDACQLLVCDLRFGLVAAGRQPVKQSIQY